MLDALRQRTVATVLFDEHHGEAWSIRPEAAARMRPGSPRRRVLRPRRRPARRAGLRGATTAGRPLDDAAWPASTYS